MMTRAAGDLQCRPAATRGQRVYSPIDLGDHLHHLPRDELGALLIGREVELLERLPFLSDMAELAANTEVPGEVAHDADDLDYRRRLWDDVHVDERVGRPVF